MERHWHDVSIPLRLGMSVWPGDPEFTFEPCSRIAEGASCNTSRMTLGTHTGTHCDAPWHFVASGKTLEQLDSSLYFGKALVVELNGTDHICAADLPEAPLPDRVLFKTRNSDLPVDGAFDPAFIALAEDTAERLVKDGVRLVGIDYLSIAPKGKSGPVHRILLGAGVLVVEGLRLAGIAPGLHEFVVLPLPVVGADGAPCRAFLYA